MNVPEHLHQHAAQLLSIETDGAIRRGCWAAILSLRPVLDGDMWSVLWGPNLHEGIAGFGSTPEEAMLAFDATMRTTTRWP